MLSMGGADDKSDRASGADLLAEALTNPPHDTSWKVTTAERLEVRDEAGVLFAWTSQKGGSVKDAGGRMLVSFVPAIKQQFSRSSIIGSALGGILGPNTPPWSPGGTTEAPPLNLKYMPLGLPFAQVQPEANGTDRIELLPSGRINDKIINRALAPEAVSRIRARSPLLYQRGPANLAELSDPQGCVLARVRSTADPPEERAESAWSIDVLDNDLAGVWLFAILLGCRRWHR